MIDFDGNFLVGITCTANGTNSIGCSGVTPDVNEVYVEFSVKDAAGNTLTHNATGGTNGTGWPIGPFNPSNP